MLIIMENQYLIKLMASVPNVINQIQIEIGAKNVTPKDFKKILVIGLMEMNILTILFKIRN